MDIPMEKLTGYDFNQVRPYLTKLFPNTPVDAVEIGLLKESLMNRGYQFNQLGMFHVTTNDSNFFRLKLDIENFMTNVTLGVPTNARVNIYPSGEGMYALKFIF